MRFEREDAVVVDGSLGRLSRAAKIRTAESKVSNELCPRNWPKLASTVTVVLLKSRTKQVGDEPRSAGGSHVEVTCTNDGAMEKAFADRGGTSSETHGHVSCWYKDVSLMMMHSPSLPSTCTLPSISSNDMRPPTPNVLPLPNHSR